MSRRTNQPQRQGHAQGSGSASTVIDLTGPDPPSNVYPTTLPSQNMEIIDINSDDEYNVLPPPAHNVATDEDNLEFMRWTEVWSNEGGAGSSSGARSNSGAERSTSRNAGEGTSRSRSSAWDRLADPLNYYPGLFGWNTTPAPGTPTRGASRTPSRPLIDRVMASIRPRRRQAHHVHHHHVHADPGMAQFLHSIIHALDDRQGHGLEDHHRRRPWFESQEPGEDLLAFLDEQVQGPPLEPVDETPPQVRPGYTKTIDDHTELCCPVCERELGHAGEATKLWVIMGCGHVLCDPCSKSLFVAKTPTRAARKVKGKGRKRQSEDGEDDYQDQPSATFTASLRHRRKSVASVDGEMAADEEDADTAAHKRAKRIWSHCPSCNRRIKMTALQQVYL